MNVIRLMWELLMEDKAVKHRLLDELDGWNLLTYRVLPTSLYDGFIEWIPSTPMRKVLSTHSNVLAWVAEKGGTSEPEARRRFLRSTAVWTVVTFLLGVMDRHLDNYKITKRGDLFHVDFGFILGRVPGGQEPLMRIGPEFAQTLNEAGMQEFTDLCVAVFLSLRRHSRIITDVLSFLADENCGDPRWPFTRLELSEVLVPRRDMTRHSSSSIVS